MSTYCTTSIHSQDEDALACYIQALYGSDIPGRVFIETNPTSWQRFMVAAITPIAALVTTEAEFGSVDGIEIFSDCQEASDTLSKKTGECGFLELCEGGLLGLAMSFVVLEPSGPKGFFQKLFSKKKPVVMPPLTDNTDLFYASWERCPQPDGVSPSEIVQSYLAAQSAVAQKAYALLLRPVAAMMVALDLNADVTASRMKAELSGSIEIERLVEIQRFVSQQLDVVPPESKNLPSEEDPRREALLREFAEEDAEFEAMLNAPYDGEEDL